MTTGKQAGYTYMALLLALAVISMTVGLGASMLTNSVRRDKEEDLLYAGDQIRQAIERYHALNLTGQYPYPRDLDALLRDPFQPGLKRHLRRVYLDPISPAEDWVLIRDERRGIIGVHSSSTREPLKTGGFPKEYENFRNAKTYADWHFIAAGAVAAIQQKPSPFGPDASPPGAAPLSVQQPVPAASVLQGGSAGAAASQSAPRIVQDASAVPPRSAAAPSVAPVAAPVQEPLRETPAEPQAVQSPQPNVTAKPAAAEAPATAKPAAASPPGAGSASSGEAGAAGNPPAPPANASAPPPASGTAQPFVIKPFGQ